MVTLLGDRLEDRNGNIIMATFLSLGQKNGWNLSITNRPPLAFGPGKMGSLWKSIIGTLQSGLFREMALLKGGESLDAGFTEEVELSQCY